MDRQSMIRKYEHKRDWYIQQAEQSLDVTESNNYMSLANLCIEVIEDFKRVELWRG